MSAAPARAMVRSWSRLRLGAHGEDMHPGLDLVVAGVLLVLHLAVNKGEQGPVLAHAHVLAGVDAGAHLANEEVAARTFWPPKRLTPRRCPALSRPFLELPPAFL